MIAKLGSGWAILTWENTVSEDLLYNDILSAYSSHRTLETSSYSCLLRWDTSLKESREPSRSSSHFLYKKWLRSTDTLGFVWTHLVVIQDFYQPLNYVHCSFYFHGNTESNREISEMPPLASTPRWKCYLQMRNWEQSSMIRYGPYWWILSPNMILILCNTDCI